MTRLLLPFTLVFLGCDGGSTPTDTADTATDADTAADTDTDTDADTDTDTDVDTTKAGVSGTILLPDGSPAANFRVNVCKAQCFTVRTETDGTYAMSGLAADTASLYVEASGENNYAVPYAPLSFAEGEAKTVNLTLREIDGTTNLASNGDHLLGEWGVLDADASSYETALGDAIPEVTWAMATAPVEQPPVEIEGQTVVAMVYFGTFEGRGSGTLHLVDSGSMPPGSVVNVYYAELPEQSGWTLGGSLTSVEGQALLDGGAELPVLTAVAFTMSQ